mmetsp:Transcript_22005/g.69203  ORF Transcript_22005/g.69203 Transcript_22005/m.69203 type:complete len:296 (+) Transcript_22005:121-1008(+)
MYAAEWSCTGENTRTATGRQKARASQPACMHARTRAQTPRLRARGGGGPGRGPSARSTGGSAPAGHAGHAPPHAGHARRRHSGRRHARRHAGGRHHGGHTRRPGWEARRQAGGHPTGRRQLPHLGLHLDGCRATHAAHRAGEACWCGAQGRCRHAAASNLATARPGLNLRLLWARGRGRLCHQRHNGLAAEHDETESPLHLLLIVLSALGLDLSKLFAIRQDDVHVLVEGHEGAHEHPLVRDGHTDAVVQPLGHARVAPRHGSWLGRSPRTEVVAQCLGDCRGVPCRLAPRTEIT